MNPNKRKTFTGDRDISMTQPNTHTEIVAVLHDDFKVTIPKGTELIAKRRKAEQNKEAFDKAIEGASSNDSIDVTMKDGSYTVSYKKDVTYPSLSAATYLIVGGLPNQPFKDWKLVDGIVQLRPADASKI